MKDQDFKGVYTSLPKLTAEDVADAVIYTLSTAPHVQVLLSLFSSAQLWSYFVVIVGARSDGETIGRICLKIFRCLCN